MLSGRQAISRIVRLCCLNRGLGGLKDYADNEDALGIANITKKESKSLPDAIYQNTIHLHDLASVTGYD
jgi:hypothetical protein